MYLTMKREELILLCFVKDAYAKQKKRLNLSAWIAWWLEHLNPVQEVRCSILVSYWWHSWSVFCWFTYPYMMYWSIYVINKVHSRTTFLLYYCRVQTLLNNRLVNCLLKRCIGKACSSWIKMCYISSLWTLLFPKIF